MSGTFARLNPAERRFGLVVAVLLFAVLNYLLIWPHFSDWGVFKRRLDQARNKRADYAALIEQAAKLKPEMDRMKGEAGDVPLEDQALQFSRIIQNQANQSGVGGVNFGRMSTSTNNPFFLDLSQTISVQQSGEQQLVDFLYKLSAGNSIVRVRSLSIHPNAPRQQLAGNITLVASYQKKPKTPAVPAVTPGPASPTVKPAAKTTPQPPAQPPATKPVPAKQTPKTK